jgi:hypothetical protein
VPTPTTSTAITRTSQPAVRSMVSFWLLPAPAAPGRPGFGRDVRELPTFGWRIRSALVPANPSFGIRRGVISMSTITIAMTVTRALGLAVRAGRIRRQPVTAPHLTPAAADVPGSSPAR